jgi:hypothetical protein
MKNSVYLTMLLPRKFFFRNQPHLHVPVMFDNGSGQNEHFIQRTFHRCFLSSFGSFGHALSEQKIFKLANKKQELPVMTTFVIGSGRNEQSL